MSDDGETMFNSDKKPKQLWTTKHHFAKIQYTLKEGDTLPSAEIILYFASISEVQFQQYEAGAKQMKGMLVSVNMLISDVMDQSVGGGCFDGGWRHRQSSTCVCKYDCKICDEYFETKP